jgi:hypothetical protein
MSLLSNLLARFRFVRSLEQRILDLQGELDRSEAARSQEREAAARWTRFCPHGHFYSPLPSGEEIAAAYSRAGAGPPFAAIDYNDAAQFALFRELVSYVADFPFTRDGSQGLRFQLGNTSYVPYDAFVLYGIVRRLRPRRIIEVGCGHTSAALLDLRDILFDGKLELTFIDPYLGEFRRRIRPGDEGRCRTIETPVQEVPFEVFGALEANDILFLDTSHISKVGSDVNHLFFNVLPALRPGVWIHVHDVPADLEYPRAWFDEGRAWNEVYLLRAFLMYNRNFEVRLSSAHLYNHHIEFFQREMPGLSAGGGSQLWLEVKVDPVMGAAFDHWPRRETGAEPAAAAPDAGPRGDPPVNFSARGHVGAGGNVLSGGFVLRGPARRTLLFRAVGPGLAPFGVSGVLKRPVLTVFDSNPGNRRSTPQIIAIAEGWGTAPRVGLSEVAAESRAATEPVMSGVGAFALQPGGRDSALVLTLPPGAYSATVSGADGETGIALLEVYEIAPR